MVAKKRNKAANKNETSGKNEFVMQIVNSNVEESMYTLVKGLNLHIFIIGTYRLTLGAK